VGEESFCAQILLTTVQCITINVKYREGSIVRRANNQGKRLEMKVLRCRDRGDEKTCEFVAAGETEQEVNKALDDHIEKDHGEKSGGPKSPGEKK
jgi:predicted small metal-binding protein